MSGPIRSTITFNLLSMTNVKPRDYECPVDPNQSAEVNALVLTAAHQRVREAIRVVHTCLDDVRQALGAWTDLCRKMSADERAQEEQRCAQFKQDRNLDDELIKGMGILSELNDVARDIDRDLSLQKAKIPRAPLAAAVPAPAVNASKDPELRPLELTEFTGSPGESWEEFKDTFQDRVCQRYTENSTRMAYLQMYVKGLASKVIAGLKRDEFPLAVKALDDKYGDKTTYVRELHNQLANIKPCTNGKGLSDFKMELNRLVRQLTSLGEDVSGPQTFLALERKIPTFALRKVLDRQSSRVGWTTDDFCKTVGDIVKCEEKLASIRGDQRPLKTKTPAIRENSEQKSDSESESLVFVTTQQRERTLCCSFCSSNGHLRLRCPTYDTLEKRIERAKALGLCFNCFNTDHVTVRCPMPKPNCQMCGGPHNIAMCSEQTKRRESGQEAISFCIIAESLKIHEEPKIITSEITGCDSPVTVNDLSSRVSRNCDDRQQPVVVVNQLEES